MNGTTAASAAQSSSSEVASVGGRPSSVRHSMDLNFFAENSADSPTKMMQPQANSVHSTPPKLQSSFSSNDVPTVKNTSGAGVSASNANNHAQQYLHNHNASMGRIPPGAMPNRHSRELSTDNNVAVTRDPNTGYASIGSALHANAPPFNHAAMQGQSLGPNNGVTSPVPNNNYGAYYNGGGGGGGNFAPNGNGPSPYPNNIPLLSAQLQGMSVSGGSMYSQQNFTGYGSMYGTPNQTRDSQARVIQARRQVDNEGMFSWVMTQSTLP